MKYESCNLIFFLHSKDWKKGTRPVPTLLKHKLKFYPSYCFLTFFPQTNSYSDMPGLVGGGLQGGCV